jgi:hypothetical protein
MASLSQACMQNHMTTIVHRRVFLISLFLFNCMEQPQKVVHFTSLTIATFVISISPFNCVETPAKKNLLCFVPRDLRDSFVTVVSPKHPRPQDAHICRRTCMGRKMQEKKLESAFGVPLSHPSNH